MKLFFVRGRDDYDDDNPILVLADTKQEAEALFNSKEMFEDNAPDELGKAGKGYNLKKGVIWKQFNAG